MKQTLPLNEMEAAGLESLVRAQKAAEQRLSYALESFGARVGATAIVGYSFNPPSVTVEMEDRKTTSAPDEQPQTVAVPEKKAPEEIQA